MECPAWTWVPYVHGSLEISCSVWDMNTLGSHCAVRIQLCCVCVPVSASRCRKNSVWLCLYTSSDLCVCKPTLAVVVKINILTELCCLQKSSFLCMHLSHLSKDSRSLIDVYLVLNLLIFWSTNVIWASSLCQTVLDRRVNKRTEFLFSWSFHSEGSIKEKLKKVAEDELVGWHHQLSGCELE